MFWNAITANYLSTKHSSHRGTTGCPNQCVRNKKAGCKEQAHVHIFSESLEVKACTSRQLLVTTYYSHFNLPLPPSTSAAGHRRNEFQVAKLLNSLPISLRAVSDPKGLGGNGDFIYLGELRVSSSDELDC